MVPVIPVIPIIPVNRNHPFQLWDNFSLAIPEIPVIVYFS